MPGYNGSSSKINSEDENYSNYNSMINMNLDRKLNIILILLSINLLLLGYHIISRKK